MLGGKKPRNQRLKPIQPLRLRLLCEIDTLFLLKVEEREEVSKGDLWEQNLRICILLFCLLLRQAVYWTTEKSTMQGGGRREGGVYIEQGGDLTSEEDHSDRITQGVGAGDTEGMQTKSDAADVKHLEEFAVVVQEQWPHGGVPGEGVIESEILISAWRSGGARGAGADDGGAALANTDGWEDTKDTPRREEQEDVSNADLAQGGSFDAADAIGDEEGSEDGRRTRFSQSSSRSVLSSVSSASSHANSRFVRPGCHSSWHKPAAVEPMMHSAGIDLNQQDDRQYNDTDSQASPKYPKQEMEVGRASGGANIDSGRERILRDSDVCDMPLLRDGDGVPMDCGSDVVTRYCHNGVWHAYMFVKSFLDFMNLYMCLLSCVMVKEDDDA